MISGTVGFLHVWQCTLLIYVTISAKTRIDRTNMYTDKILKLFVKLRMLLENIYKDWWGQQSAKEAIYHLTCLAMESLKIFVSFL